MNGRRHDRGLPGISLRVWNGEIGDVEVAGWSTRWIEKKEKKSEGCDATRRYTVVNSRIQ